MSKTTRHPDGSFASPGGVRQEGGSLPLYRCNRCLSDVVWATSRRTGRKYLANVRIGYKGQRFYIGADIHNCAEVAAQRDAIDARFQSARRIEQLTLDAQEAMRRGDREEALRLIDLMGESA